MILASYRPGGVFRPVLKPRNESQLVLRAKGKLLQTRGAATEKLCLPNIVLQLQLTVPVTTNVERAVVDRSEVLQPDSQD